MTGSVAIDVVLGLVFVYLLYSLLASLVQEIVATNLALRAKILEKGITRMLQDDEGRNAFIDRIRGFLKLLSRSNSYSKDSLAEALYAQPGIKYLGEDNWHRKPSYLKARQFSEALIQLLKERDQTKQGISDVLSRLSELGLTGKETQKHFEHLWEKAGGDIQKFSKELETWFDDTMERATGWYKRYNQVFLFVIGFGIAIAFNVDSIYLARTLSKDKNLRDALVTRATVFIESQQALIEIEKGRQNRIKELLKAPKADSLRLDSLALASDTLQKIYIDSLNARQRNLDSLLEEERNSTSLLLGMGWERKKTKECACDKGIWKPKNYSWSSWIGWFITALAISLGAPFWYDLLSKVIKIRTSVASLAAGTTDKQDKRR